MKGISNLVWIFVAIGIIIAAGTGLVGIANIQSFFQLPGAEMVTVGDQSCQLVQPTFGYLACDPIAGTQPPVYNTWDIGSIVSCYESTPNCEVYVKYERSWYNPYSCAIDYTKNGVPASAYLSPGEQFLTSLSPGGKVMMTNKCIGAGKITAGKSFIPYGIVVYDLGKKTLYQANTCKISSMNWPGHDSGDVCKSDTTSKYCQATSLKTGKGNALSDILAYGDWVNYLISFVPVAIDASHRVETYNGNPVYCIQGNYGATAYSLEKYTTADNACYAYQSNPISVSWECCNGIRTSDALCVDHKWVKESTIPPENITCFSALQCRGGGEWYADYDTAVTDICRETCSGGHCAVQECKVVGCTPPNVGCAPGYVCQDYKCVQSSGGVTPPSGGFNWMRLLKLIGISIAFTFVMMLLGRFVNRLKPIFGKLSDPKIFALVAAILTAVFWFAGQELKSIAIAIVVSAVIVGIISIFVPILRIPMIFLIAWIVLSLIAIFIFAIPLASLTASVFGGT